MLIGLAELARAKCISHAMWVWAWAWASLLGGLGLGVGGLDWGSLGGPGGGPSPPMIFYKKIGARFSIKK